MKPKAFLLIALLCEIFLLACSTVAAETFQEETKKDDVKEPEQQGGHCRYGCCGGWGHHGCRRCCRTADEAEATKQINGDGGYGGGGRWGGGGHGGKCRYGCCWGQGWHCRCCPSSEEAKAYVHNEAKP